MWSRFATTDRQADRRTDVSLWHNCDMVCYTAASCTNNNKKHLKNVGPIRDCEPPHAHSPGVASSTVACRLRIDVHNANDDDDDDDNVWQRGPPAFHVPRSTWSWWVTTIVGKPSTTGQPTRSTQPFILLGVDKWVEADVCYRVAPSSESCGGNHRPVGK